MSGLSDEGLFRLECVVRAEAERIRFRNPEADLGNRAISTEARVHIQNERRRADDFDLIGNLLAGLQADWNELGPKVRAGYLRQRQDYEAIKDQRQTEEDAA